ncbi:TIGR02466 family protein [Stakelama saccharophila]|uniref:TIGR02466 family protein n=1 Tax=Stakelama saccharophila TaxID=3075605 RepID=A0ABZ0BC75_9SPHN|nr:TIGR02466 family protein [Stakelama sp. W311]WNO54888.1 TIGR02466 family protein [Stakelama sp. W311]
MAAPSDPLRVRAEHIGLFETGILHGHVEDATTLNADLKAAIAQRRGQDAGLNRSNVGGWHSTTDMLYWGGPAAERVWDTALRMAKRLSYFEARDPDSVAWSVRMWANVSPPGALNMSHAHPGVLWAAVYYVDMGEEPGGSGGGELYFEDPRFPVPLMTFPGFRAVGVDGRPQQNERRLTTRAGDLVLFPAWVRHGVRPHCGSRERISIAMNIYGKEK